MDGGEERRQSGVVFSSDEGAESKIENLELETGDQDKQKKKKSLLAQLNYLFLLSV